MNALGEKFDPAYHQAMLQRTDEEHEDGVVLEVFQTGYTLNGRVLRPAKVVVNKLLTAAEEYRDEYTDKDSDEDDNDIQ